MQANLKLMYAHGKLLLTGEYFVLDGALALAVPTRLGQRLQAKAAAAIPADELHWRSLTRAGEVWFSGRWLRQAGEPVLHSSSDDPTAQRLQELLRSIEQQKPGALAQHLFGRQVDVQLEFPRDWGLGSSSTLVSLLAQQTQTDPYRLLADSFGGSGYDIACATAAGPIFYQRTPEELPVVSPANWLPPFHEQLFFAYQGHKQNSREGIRYYRELGGVQAGLLDEVSDLTRAFFAAQTLAEASKVAAAHEDFISTILQMERVQTERFADFPGVVKSLGAWGGDFALVFSPWPAAKTRAYFNEKGCPAVLNFSELV